MSVRFGSRVRISCAFIVAGMTVLPARVHGQAPLMPDSIRRYLTEAIDTLQRVSMHRDSVDWVALRDSVFTRASAATRTDDTWRTLQWALRRVDRHSFIQTPRSLPPMGAPPLATPRPPTGTPVPTSSSAKAVGPPAVSGRLIDDRFGYLLVPWFAGTNRPSFVDSLQTLIEQMDSVSACGWIIDLRFNSGGNMWPMLAGVGPLLGDSVFGSFYTMAGEGVPWRYRNGHAWSGSAEIAEGGAGSLPAYRVHEPLAPVALLIGRTTASSGEATLLAFLGRPNVRSFGDTTAGYNSVNNGYKLSDGATLVITVGYSRDRVGRAYALSVAPDELVPSSSDPSRDAPLDHARAWLSLQPMCAGRR